MSNEVFYLCLRIVIIVFSCMGLVGSSWILYKKQVNPSLFKNVMGRVILALAISDFLNSLLTLTADPGPKSGLSVYLCHLQGVAMYLSNISSALLGLAIAINAFYIVCLHGSTIQLIKFQKAYIFSAFILPSIIACIPILLKNYDFYGSTDLWCWVADPMDRLEFFYIPLWIILSLNAIASFITWRELRKLKYGENQHRVKLMKILCNYSLVVILAWFPGSLNRINEILSYHMGPKHIYQLAQGIFQPARGALNAILFYYVCLEKGKPLTDTEQIVATAESIQRVPQNTIDDSGHPSVSINKFVSHLRKRSISIGGNSLSIESSINHLMTMEPKNGLSPIPQSSLPLLNSSLDSSTSQKQPESLSYEGLTNIDIQVEEKECVAEQAFSTNNSKAIDTDSANLSEETESDPRTENLNYSHPIHGNSSNSEYVQRNSFDIVFQSDFAVDISSSSKFATL
ncbi:hypothetical protein BC833DRAFT_572876 [Globomyces pollinis-pini]|nr:hypothetical protein BC833DRAFT_572876 [Globomyces pollinis-pini]